MNKGLAIMPAVNLISNIGFWDDSTHTSQIDYRIVDLGTEGLRFLLIHPKNVATNFYAQKITQDIF